MTGSASKKIRDRIRQLREMTSERGCTEAEALAAAEKAAQLMRDHGLSDADIVMDEQRSQRRAAGRSVKAQLWPIIAACTNTVPTLTSDAAGRPIVTFIGRAPGPDIAAYLRDVCERAVDRAVREFKQSPFYRRRRGLASKRAAVSGFVQAMVSRLGNRLWSIFGPQHDPDALDDARSAQLAIYGQGRAVKARDGSLRHCEARALGWMAGGKVGLAHGVGADHAPLQIGGAA